VRGASVRAVKLLAATVALAACTTPSKPIEPGWEFPQIPEEPQRAGDPAAGYDYLVNGGYITCGIPKAAYDKVASPTTDQEVPGRSGDNLLLPYNFSAATSSEGTRVISANCLSCHAGRINGELVVGLGAADADFTTDQARYVNLAGGFVDAVDRPQYERFRARIAAIAPYTITRTVGVNPADNLTAALMAHRDPETFAWSAEPMLELPPAAVIPVDVPPWWRMAKKTSMFYSGAGRGDHARIMMAASLLCTESVAEAEIIDAAFADVRAWITQIPPPVWPFPIDAERAAVGKPIFEATCSRCHGTYGDGGYYPNEIVPLDEVGTDGALAQGAAQFADPYVAWFGASFWGETSRLEPQEGYVPPPLDGIWATAPFFHNGSVPTLEAVLDSSKRPTHWTRSFASTDYDQAALGWNFTETGNQASEPNAQKRVRIYDTTHLGYGNGGHDYGDMLTDEERAAVLEYLKTI
jgi:mono/diheme cytochrome c family protein